MIDLISLAFPLLLIAFLHWRFPVDPTLYVNESTRSIAVNNEELSARAKRVYFLVSVTCAIVISLCQLVLIRSSSEHPSEFLFESRMIYSSAYPFLPGLVLGFFVGMVLCFHYVRRYGENYFLSLLRKRWNGTTLFARYSWARTLGIVLGLTAFALNLVAYNTYLLVTQHDIKYRRWRSSVVHKPISALKELRTDYHPSLRGDAASETPRIKLVFNDGTTIDTTFIVPPQRRDELIESIKLSMSTTVTPEL